MKANKHFKLSKPSKMQAATIIDANKRHHFISSMVQAEMQSRMAPPRANRNERKDFHK
jgi:hypothetical protein